MNRPLSRIISTATTTVLMLVSALLVAPPAQAAGGDAEQALALVNRLAPLGAEVGSASRGSAEVRGSLVRSGNVDVVIGESSLANLDKSKEHVIRAAKAHYVVRDTSDGVQLVAVMASRDAGSSVSYRFPHKVLDVQPNGTVVVRNSVLGEPVGLVEPAWAMDATGATVATRYEVRGDSLVQVIAPTSASVYPIIADPRIRSAWYGWSVDFTYGETTTIAVSASGCATLAWLLPPPADAIMGFSCGAFALVAGQARAANKCLSVKFFWAGFGTPWISPCYAW